MSIQYITIQNHELCITRFTISVHQRLQVLVLADDIGYLTNCQIPVLVLLDNNNKKMKEKK